MSTPTPQVVGEATVTLFADQAEELARLLGLFIDYVDACGDPMVEDLTDFYHGVIDAAGIGQIVESLTWAEKTARHLRRAAAAARITANGARL